LLEPLETPEHCCFRCSAPLPSSAAEGVC
jgi:hypothetical protein